jgi:Ca2+-binding RTX toxin-like protein
VLGGEASGIDAVIDFSGMGTAGDIDTITSTITRSLLFADYSDIENLTLLGASAIDGTGNDLDNVLTGNNAQNTLIGGIGNDTLNGGAGIDTLDGGANDDVYVLGGDADIVSDSSGIDTITSIISRTIATLPDIENLILLGTANINGTGNGSDNALTGNVGNNTLNGGGGSDTLDGGAGNDIYELGTEASGLDTLFDVSGTDTIHSTITRDLAPWFFIENLLLQGGTDINGTGNGNNNGIHGNSGDNILAGLAGVDALNGSVGDDFLFGQANQDNLTGGPGDDTLVFQIASDSPQGVLRLRLRFR